MKPLFINIYGGPGSGKSTAMAYIFSKLKMKGVNVDMVMEFAKEVLYQGNLESLKNQIYIFGNQYQRFFNVARNVDVVVTDAPIFMSIVYNSLTTGREEFDALVNELGKRYRDKNYFLERVTPYSTDGRHQNEEQANDVSRTIIEKLKKYDINYEVTNSLAENLDKIVDEVVEMLKNK